MLPGILVHSPPPLNSYAYITYILTPFFEHLIMRDSVAFPPPLEAGATAHTTNNSVLTQCLW
jgi:hypothetical protein